jgi:hypothetical protein
MTSTSSATSRARLAIAWWKATGFVLGDGPQPFHHLQVAAAGQPVVGEQLGDLAGVPGLPVQGGGVRAGRVERADPCRGRIVR